MLKSIAAVIVGLLLVMFLVMITDVILGMLVPSWYPEPGQGPAPAGVYFMTFAYGAIYAVIAGYATGVVAGRRETLHALVVGIIILIINVAMQAGSATVAEMAVDQPSWYLIGMPIIGIAGLTFGGWLREKQMAEAPPPPIPE